MCTGNKDTILIHAQEEGQLLMSIEPEPCDCESDAFTATPTQGHNQNFAKGRGGGLKIEKFCDGILIT